MLFTKIHSFSMYKSEISTSLASDSITLLVSLIKNLEYFHFQNIFITPQIPSCPFPQATADLSLATLLSFLEFHINHTVCSLLCLASFIQHDIFEIHPCSCLCSCLLLSITPMVWMYHFLLIHSPVDEHFIVSIS